MHVRLTLRIFEFAEGRAETCEFSFHRAIAVGDIRNPRTQLTDHQPIHRGQDFWSRKFNIPV